MITSDILYYCKFCNKETNGLLLKTKNKRTNICYILLTLCFIIPGLMAILMNTCKD